MEELSYSGSGMSSGMSSLAASGASYGLDGSYGSLLASAEGLFTEGVLGKNMESFLEQRIAEVNLLLGEEVVRFQKDLGLVRMDVRLDSLVQPQDTEKANMETLSGFLELPLDQSVVVDFCYTSTSTDKAKISVSMLKDKRTAKDLAVCDWLRDIVQHVQQLFFENRKELRHWGMTHTLQERKKFVVGEGGGKLDGLIKTMSGKGKTTKELSKLLSSDSSYYSTGGIWWKRGAKKQCVDRTETETLILDKKIETLTEMGFHFLDVVFFVDEHPEMESDRLAMLISDAGLRGRSADEEQALSTLVELGHGKVESARMLLRHGFDLVVAIEEMSLQVKEPAGKIAVPAELQENLFVCVMEFLGERLNHYQNYCISCHAPHNCKAVNGVVCPSALCVFRWEELGLDALIPTYQCVFDRCGCTDWGAKCLEYFGESVDAVSAKYGCAPQTVLEMAFHKYLPPDEMMKFMKVIKDMKASSIRSCLNPKLCARFERRLLDLKQAGRKGDELKPHVAYHGTRQENIEKILDTGFLLSKLAANTGNRGAFGAGIYCSPQANYCVGYCRSQTGEVSLIVCAVLMGKRYTGPKATLGAPLADGHDSHTDPSGMAEWILFDEGSILPCFVLHVKNPYGHY